MEVTRTMAIASHCLAPFAFLATSCTTAPFVSESDDSQSPYRAPIIQRFTSTVLP